jgi:hypothetical protein
MRFRLAPILLVALALLVAGCGGSDDSAAPAEETTAAQTNASEPTTTTSETEDASTSFASAENCTQLANLSAAMSQAITASAENDLDAQAKLFQEFADQSPEEIRSDFQVIAKAFSTYLEAYAKIDLEPGATPTPAQIAELTRVAQAFSQADVQQASTNISAWVAKNCTTR